MKRLISITIVLWASVCAAGVGDFVAGHLYTIPGTVQTASLVTVVQCTNTDATGFGLINVTAQFFDEAGQFAGSASVNLAGGATRIISSGTVNGLTVDANANVPNGTEGSARIVADVRIKKIICAAYVMAPDAAPGVMNPLPVLAKNKQKGD